MSDIIDDACTIESLLRDSEIRNARSIASGPKVYHTHCAWCGEPTENGDKFCSYGVDSCATDANRRDEALRRTWVVR